MNVTATDTSFMNSLSWNWVAVSVALAILVIIGIVMLARPRQENTRHQKGKPIEEERIFTPMKKRRMFDEIPTDHPDKNGRRPSA